MLLAPCDIPQECAKFLGKEEYEIAKRESTRLINEGKQRKLINFSVNANGKISAETYYNDFLPEDVYKRQLYRWCMVVVSSCREMLG